MKKFLSFIIGFVLCACALLTVSVSSVRFISNQGKILVYHNSDARNSCLTAMKVTLKENSIPVFGSSELSASDEIGYPKTLFRNGESDFNMVLSGRGHMQSLHHAINVGAMGEEIPNQKVVLILSPQWFTDSGVRSEAYANCFSERMYAEFLKNRNISMETKQKVADRVEELLVSDPKQLKRIEEYETVFLYKSLNPIRFIKISLYDSFMKLKQQVTLIKEIEKIDLETQNYVKVEDIDFNVLRDLANRAGEKACTNNNFYIYDEYYDTYIKNSLEEEHNSAVGNSYLVSPEYDDFRLFLEICQETGIEPLIINVPVNGYWYDWIGFSREEREGYYQKIRDICGEYNVKLSDFSDKEYEPYFLKDTMHLGWKGWVYLDEAVYKFYQND